ncbi:hypothetical protein BKA93DRAFT_740057, partial [Sparassis latifolia]
KPDQFRAVDWLVELGNLYTKDTYSGEGSNYTKDRILTESPNILVYRSCMCNIEWNLHLNSLMWAHATKDMFKTFKSLGIYMQEQAVNEHHPGRIAVFTIKDFVSEGIELLFNGTAERETEEIESGVEHASAEDLSVEAPL